MKTNVTAGIRISALAGIAAAALALHDVPASQAQAPVFLNFGLNGNVQAPPAPDGLEGKVTITCEGNPGQTKSGEFPVGSTTKGLSANIACDGPVKVEGQVWKQGDQAGSTTCTPYQLREPARTGMNHAQFGTVRADGGSISCTMSASAM